jgi:hypothetical protein
LWCDPLALTRDGKRDTIDDYAGCYIFHAPLRSQLFAGVAGSAVVVAISFIEDIQLLAGD